MKLNLHMLRNSLEKLGFQGELNKSYYDRRLAWPQLCSEWPEHPAEDVLYIVESSTLPKASEIPSKISLLCLGVPPEGYLEGACELLFTLDESVTPSQVMNIMSAEFARFSEWESAMKSAAARPSPQKMAKLTAQLLENPVEIWQTGYYLLCSAAPDLDYECPELEIFKRDYIRQTDYVMPEEEFELLMTDEEYLQSSATREPAIYSGKPHGFRTLFFVITISDTPVARICVSEIVQTITARDFAIVRILGDMVADVLFQASPHSFLKENRYLEVVMGLLDHRLQPESQIVRFLSERKWNMDDSYVCFAIKTRLAAQHAESDLAGFSFRFAEFFDATCYVLHEGTLVFVFNLTKSGKERNEVYRTAVPLLRDSLLIAGVSTVFRDFRDLYYFFKQALCALDLGRERYPERWYYKFDDFQLDYLLSQYCKGMHWKALLPSGLFALVEHDRHKQTDFVNTLRTYLDTGCNTARTVEALFIHRNTLAYRLERIETITGIDLDDANQRIILHLALQILDEHRM